MDDLKASLESECQLITEAQEQGTLATIVAYAKLSGPGWLQSAITLGGGSLASSLYLGVLAGFSLLWLQPFAMILGIVMLSAIGYVTMSTGERPFRAINRHVNPVLGWGWALASLIANMVWALPQYSLATGVLQQNLFPDVEWLHGNSGKVIIVAAILFVTTLITWSYDSGGWGVRLYEIILKILVGMIVLCFFGVVVKLALSEEGLQWGAIFAGFVPNFGAIFDPAPTFKPLLASVSDEFQPYWRELIVGKQRDVLISAAATAVGINMTFLFPYSILKRGWGKEFRGAVKFDLATGMFIPFLLATSCVVIASATQFHATPQPGLLGEVNDQGQRIEARASIVGNYKKLLAGRTKLQLKDSGLKGDDLVAEIDRRSQTVPESEKRLAATLVTRDAADLVKSLKPLTGDFFGNVLFGVGVLGMALSTITLLMLISGFVICEIFSLPPSGWGHRLGTLAAATGVLGPFIWSGEARFWLAIPTSVFGFTLLPIAYLSFFLLMNQRSLLASEMPRGIRRVAWNLTMAIAAGVATVGSVYMVWVKARWIGIAAVVLFLTAAMMVHLSRKGDKEPVRNPSSR